MLPEIVYFSIVAFSKAKLRQSLIPKLLINNLSVALLILFHLIVYFSLVDTLTTRNHIWFFCGALALIDFCSETKQETSSRNWYQLNFRFVFLAKAQAEIQNLELKVNILRNTHFSSFAFPSL